MNCSFTYMISELRVIPFLLLLLNTGFGQAPASLSKEQLFAELKKTLPDSSRQDYLNQLGKIYFAQSWRKPALIDSALLNFRKAVYLDDSANPANKEITNQSLILLGRAYLRSRDFSTGIRIFDQVIGNYSKAANKVAEADTRIVRGRFFEYFRVYPEIAENDYKIASSLYDESGDNQKRIEGVLQLANLYLHRHEFTLADSGFRLALKASFKNKLYKISEIYCDLSSVNRYDGNFDRALKYSMEAVKYAEQSGVIYNISECYGELALVYQELNKPEQSVYWYQRCLEIRSRNPMERFIYYTTCLMTIQMIKAGRTNEAIGFLDSLTKANPPLHADEKASRLQSFAYCYDALKDYSKAERCYLAMLKEYSLGDNGAEELMIANFDVGKFYTETGQYKKAKPYLQKADGLSLSTTEQRFMELQYLLFKVDSADGEFEHAVQHLHRYHAINDSIFSVAKTKQIQELLIKYETAKKDQNIQLLEKEKIMERGELIRTRQTKNWIFGFSVLLLVIIGLLANNSRTKQLANKKLQSQQEEINRKNLALEHLVKEKEWLVKEIHHRVKNNFHIVVGLLGTQSQYLKTEEAIKTMSESQNRIQAMSLIHQKLYQSENMSAINMVEYIHDLIGHLRHSFNPGKSVLFRIAVDPIELGISHSVPIGLIINEAVTNSIKYAFPDNKAGVVLVSLTQYPDSRYVLIIRDDGCGLPAAVNGLNLSSMGLRLMRGLTEDMWGKFTIGGEYGTEVRVEFFLENEDKPGFDRSTYNSIITT